MEDMISRKAAIDAMGRATWAINRINELPSAQSEKRTDKRTETHTCDLISRQVAMEEISKQQTYKMFEGEDTVYLDANDVGSVLASLPSTQPEIIHCGDCKHRDPEDYKCDCGHDIIWQLPRDDKWYCADAERRTDEGD